MAETITFKLEITPRVAESPPATQLDGGYSTHAVLSTTNQNALILLFQKLNAGVNIGTVVTAINAL